MKLFLGLLLVSAFLIEAAEANKRYGTPRVYSDVDARAYSDSDSRSYSGADALSDSYSGSESMSGASSDNSLTFMEESPSTIKIIGGAQTTSYTNSTADCLITGAGLFKRSFNLLGGAAFGARQEVDEDCVMRSEHRASEDRELRRAELLISAGYVRDAAELLLGRVVEPLVPDIDPLEYDRMLRELSDYRLEEAARQFEK